MQLEVKIDSGYPEPKVIVLTASMTDEVTALLRRLSEHTPQVISGSKDGRIEVIDPAELIRVYASAGKVYAVTEKGKYVLRLRLYEAEQRLPPHRFVRISNSEIINLKKVENFDLSFTGTICVKLCNGAVTYVSRRYVSKIKEILGV